MHMKFTLSQKRHIVNILQQDVVDKYSKLSNLKSYLSKFREDFIKFGLDYAYVAYTIWYTYGNR